MTLTEAYRVLRRYEDVRLGFDHRCDWDAFPTGEHCEAIRLILASQGLGKPLINCARCEHHCVGRVTCCTLRVKGECTKFEEVKG